MKSWSGRQVLLTAPHGWILSRAGATLARKFSSCRYLFRNAFRPFTVEDEAQLVSVLTTRPRHVARHIRQSMASSHKHNVQFRNAVTYLMIQLQSRLQKGELSSQDASVIVESVMKECVAHRQADMAHLLFRAALRFRKYGLRLTPRCVKHLFDNYNLSGSRAHMLALAEELKEERDLRSIVMTAFLYAKRTEDAQAVLASIPPLELVTEDCVSLAEGYAATHQYGDLVRFCTTLRDDVDRKKVPQVAYREVISVALASCHQRSCPDESFRALVSLVEQHKSLCLPLSDGAVGAVLRRSLVGKQSMADVYAVEESVKALTETKELGLIAQTALISKCSELVSRGQTAGDEIMLVKVSHLRAVIEANLQSGAEVDELDQQYVLSMIKGFGILGKLDDMKAAFEILRSKDAIQDHRVYDEMLRWYAAANNLKEVVAIKEEMTRLNVHHSAQTYANVFRVLDRYYPRMVEKYFAEMRANGIALDSYSLCALLRVFSELGDTDKVEMLYAELKQHLVEGKSYLLTPSVSAQLLRTFQHDHAKVESIIADARNYGHLNFEYVQAELLNYFSIHRRQDDAVQLLRNLPRKSAPVYRVLIRDACRRSDKASFVALCEELSAAGVRYTDGLYGAILAGYGAFGDVDGLRRMVRKAQAHRDEKRSGQFFADAAAAFAKLHDWRAVDQCWESLLQSETPISMPVYNRFLDLYMSVSNLDKVQAILDCMMKNVPPNPVTATTVVDMLGKMGRLQEMELLLDDMAKSKNAVPTQVTYHQAMNAYAKAGDLAKMEQMRDTMRQRGMHENHVTYNILVEGYGRAKRMEHLKELLVERKAKGIAMEEFGYNILLNLYGRTKMVDEVRALVTEISEDPSGIARTPRMLSSMAHALAAVGDAATVETYCDRILAHPDKNQRDVDTLFVIYSKLRDSRRLQELIDNKTITKTEYAYNICISAFARVGEFAKVALHLQFMEANNMTLRRNTAMTLSSLLLKAGKLELAQAVLQMHSPNDKAYVDRVFAQAADHQKAEDEDDAAFKLLEDNSQKHNDEEATAS